MKPGGCDRTKELIGQAQTRWDRLFPEHTLPPEAQPYLQDFIVSTQSSTGTLSCTPDQFAALLHALIHAVWTEAEHVAAACVHERTSQLANIPHVDPRWKWVTGKRNEADRIRALLHQRATFLTNQSKPLSTPPSTGTGAL